jgi:hypothetical protein
VYLARILLELGELEAAETEAALGVESFAEIPSELPWALSVLATVKLALGDTAAALAASREAIERLTSGGSMIESSVLVRLVWAETLDASGDRAAANQAIAEARTALFAFVDRITDADLRRHALITVPEHARTLSLAREWIGDP